MTLDIELFALPAHGGRWQAASSWPVGHHSHDAVGAAAGAGGAAADRVAMPVAAGGSLAMAGRHPTSMLLGGLGGGMPSLPGLPGGSATAGGLGAAAGAGLGGKAMYMFCSKKCVAPAACFALKGCLDSCANKAFLAGAAGGGMASFGASKLHGKMTGGAGPLDAWTAGPVIGMWNRLEEKPGGVDGEFSQVPRACPTRRRQTQSRSESETAENPRNFL
mmetsp:Transcript_150623/g.419875  ORF Transcript_150623/g.419875 Transcript_150623/m.419875 type:complete len:219 (+) Transcript_150623:166-822(+)